MTAKEILRNGGRVKAVDVARAEYAALCRELGTDAVTEENAILSIGHEFLPPCALAVLAESDAATVEYYEWLTEQTQAAQDAHDAEYAAGHEWHGGQSCARST
jgi:hypothetical protein